MKTQSAKAKGRRLQKLVVSKILQTFSSLTERDVQSTSMGATGVDVKLSEAAFKLLPLAIECKNQQINKSFINMWKQAFNNSGNEGYTALVICANNEEPLITLNLDVFMMFMKDRYE